MLGAGGAGGSASLRPGGGGGCGAGGCSRHKRWVPRGRRCGSHGNAAPRGSPPVRAVGGCASNGALRCGRGGSQPLSPPGLPHLHLGLRRLGASPPASVPELLTEGRGVCRRPACPRWGCAPPRRILLHPVGTLPPVPRPDVATPDIAPRLCSAHPSRCEGWLALTPTNEEEGLPVYEKGARQDLIMMIMDYSIKAYLTKRVCIVSEFSLHLSLYTHSHLRRTRFCQARNDFLFIRIKNVCHSWMVEGNRAERCTR